MRATGLGEVTLSRLLSEIFRQIGRDVTHSEWGEWKRSRTERILILKTIKAGKDKELRELWRAKI